ncbi:DUF397 domain-containing protein [Actinokineospora enzanensis]|uniref:DUF397 domain-containing protein n=1 Tax=Actinokineospora enzanensis TaxID=155975 RepID=UPI00036C5CFE|nr:DUF397 domain-containing protein [Actinokineospora enzanensis]
MTQRFRQSSFCSTGACLQVAFPQVGGVTVRDSKAAASLPAFPDAAVWRTFTDKLRTGVFDSADRL